MTASLTQPYALVGEQAPTQEAHQKPRYEGLVATPIVIAPAASKPIVSAIKAKALKVEVKVPVTAPEVTTTEALPSEPLILVLPDVPAMAE
jgi:hypothetical protein